MTLEIQTPSKIIKPEDITTEDIRHMAKESFPLWCLTHGAEVDNNPIEFEKHRYLLPLYMDQSDEVVLAKAAQMGATVWMMLRVLWWLHSHQGRKAGLYMPNKELVDNTSADRLTPLMQSVPPIREMSDLNDKLGLRKVGKSSFYLLHLGGKSAKDSVPLDYVSFDEIRLCSDKDIDQTLERIAHSPYKMKLFASTTGLPGSNIDLRFQLGSQHVWHAKCNCPDGVDLPTVFPDCVVADDAKRPGQVYLRCPKCKYEIKDPQNGRYVPQNEGAAYNSYRVSQLTSKFITAKEIWDFWKRTTNRAEFFNSKLGLPYVDAENMGVTLDQLKSSCREDLPWAEPHNIENKTAMGIDQGAGYCIVTIADHKDGKKRIRHLEIIEQHNPRYRGPEGAILSPFVRCAELMHEFNVGLAVVDAMPSINDALQFARAFPGRVFLAYYSKEAKEIVQWNDKKRYKETVRKAGPLLKFKHTAVLGRFSSLDYMFGEIRSGNYIFPDPDRLRQMAYDEKTGVIVPLAPAHRLFSHLTRLVKNFHVVNEETGEGRWRWIYTGGDPHFAHSLNYCNIALERLRRFTIYTFA
jgi:Phage terminase large subunit (GpA)